MSNKSWILIPLSILCFTTFVAADGGYVHRGDSLADWWTEKTDIEYPIRIEVADSLATAYNFRGAFDVGGDSASGFIPLTYGFHWPSDSRTRDHFVLQIDGTFYSFATYSPLALTICGTPRTLYQINEYFEGSDTIVEASGDVTIVSHWRIPVMDGFIDLYQYLTPVYMVFGYDTCGMARIQFKVINNHYMSHTVGIKLLMDINIGWGPEADRPKIIVAGTYTAYSKIFTAPVPGYWQAADNSDLSLASTIARGVLRGGDATPPDYFVIGDIDALRRFIWVNTSSGCPDSSFWMGILPGYPTSNAAFLVQWDPRSIPAGGNFSWVTYYGFGSIAPPGEGINMGLILPEIRADHCMLDSIVETHTLVSQNDDLGNTYYNDTICVTPPAPLSVDSITWDTTLVGGHILSDTCIVFDSLPVDMPVDVVWYISIPPDLHNIGLVDTLFYHANSEDVADPTDSFEIITVPQFSGIPPDIWLVSDSILYVNCDSFTINVAFSDDEGIVTRDVLPIIDGISDPSYVIWDTLLNAQNDTFGISVPESLITDNDTAIVLIPSIPDSFGCQNDDTLRAYVYWDDQPPFVISPNPPDGGFTTDSAPTVSFVVCDSVSGVNTDSIDFFYTYGSDTIRLTSTSPGVVVSPDADTSCVSVSFTPTDLPSESTVTVCVTRAIDRITPPCTPNVMDTFCWSFMIDYTGPTVEFITPPESMEYVSCDTPTICFVAHDINGIMTDPCESLVVWINSSAYNGCDPNVSINGDTVCITDIYNAPYTSGTEVTVTVVNLYDSLGNPAEATGYSFTMDVAPPWVGSVDPPDGSIIGPSDGTAPLCSLLVSDDVSGLSLDNVVITMSINGGPDSVLRYPEDIDFISGWLYVRADLSDANYMDTICFSLDTLYDNADLCPPNNINPPFRWCYYLDNRPPEVVLVQPAESSVVSCEPGLGWICLDFIDTSDIVSGSVVVTVGNSSPVSGGWIFYPAENRYCGPIPMDAELPQCEPIPIVVIQASDTLGNIATYLDTFYFISDTTAPEITYMFPGDTTLASDSVMIVFDDGCSPINRSRTLFRIVVRNMGSLITDVTFDGNNPDINWLPTESSSTDTAVFFINDLLDSVGVELSNGDSVYVCVVHTEDSTGDTLCGSNELNDTTCMSILYSLGGPSVSIVEPPSGSATSCDSLCVIFAVQDSDGVDSSTVYLSYQINDGPVHIATIDSPFVEWTSGATASAPDQIIICVPESLSEGDEIRVSIDSLADIFGVRSITGRAGTYWVDWTPPVIGDVNPAPGEEISTAQPLIWAVVADSIAGVNQSNTCFIANGTDTFCTDGTIVYWSPTGDTVYFATVLAGEFFHGGDTVEICLTTEDNATMCGANDTTFCWNFTISAGGPTIHPIQPQENTIVTCDTIHQIIFVATDSNGVNFNTLHITIDAPGGTHYDLSYPSSPAITVSGDTVTVSLDFADEGTVWVSIEVQDNLGNAISGGSYTYWFAIDHTPPEIIGYTPLCDSLSMDIPETLWVLVEDPFGLPDPNRFCIGIIDTTGDTVRVCGSSTGGIYSSGDTIFVVLDSIGVQFHGGDTIVWWVEQIADWTTMCEPNYGDVGDTCHIPISASGPEITIVNPEDANGDGHIYFGCSFPYTFAFHLYDPDGYDTSSICIRAWCEDPTTGDTGSTSLTCWGDPTLSLANDTLYWDVAAFPCPAGNEMHITVEVFDNLMNPQRPNEFVVVIDTTGPGFEIVSPVEAESVMTLTPTITIRFPDPAGPDTNSVCVRLMWGTLSDPANTLEVCNTGDTMSWSGDTMFLSVPSGLFSTGDSVWVCVDSVWDAAEACPNLSVLDTCYWIFIAQGGPEITLSYPTPDSVGLYCPNDSFVFVFSDPDGVDTSSVHFADDGTEHPIGTNPYWANESTLVYVPDAPYTWSPVYLSIWGTQDMLGYTTDSTVFVLNMDVQPPVGVWIGPGSLPEPISMPPGTPTIRVQLYDSLHPVDSTTIVFYPHGLGGPSFVVDNSTADDDTLIWSIIDSSLTFYASAAGDTFLAGDTDSVCVVVGDAPGCGDYHNVDTICWAYAVSASAGPMPELVIPGRDHGTIACTDSFVITWYCNTSVGLRHSGAIISLQINSGTPTTYDDASGRITYAGDTLYFSPPISELSDGDTLHIRIEHVEDALGNPTDDPDLYSYELYVDWSGPALVDEFPVGLSGIAHPTIWMYFEDISPIDDSSVVVSISVNGGTPTTYHITDPEISWSAGVDTLYITGLSFVGGDSVQVCLDSLADRPDTCGPNWTTDTCFMFYLPQGGPVATLLYPPDSSTTFCPNQQIAIQLCDSDGVLLDSLQLVVIHTASGEADSFDINHPENLASITFIEDSTGPDFCDTLLVPPLSDFSDGETVRVHLIRAMDTLYTPSTEYEWVFVVDLSAPIADNFLPANNETIYDWHQHVSVQVWDEISWLDTTALTVEVYDNGVLWMTFTWESTQLWYDNTDSTVHLQIDTLWREFHTYCIHIIAQDTTDTVLCPPNDTVISWCFYVGDDDTVGPEITTIDSCSWPGFSTDFFVSCTLMDSSGIYDDNTDTSGQGIFLIYDTTGCPDLESGNYMGIVQMIYSAIDSIHGTAETPPGAFPQFPPGTHLYYVIYAYDNDFDFDTTGDRAQSHSACDSCYFHDIYPPEITLIDPQDGFFYACSCGTQGLDFVLLDPDGINTSAGTLRVNGVDYPFDGSPQITFSPETGESIWVHFTPENCWENGDTVRVDVWGFADNYENVYDSVYHYEFVVDWTPPEVYFEHCAGENDTNLYLGQFDTITMQIVDSLAGVNPESLKIEIAGKRIHRGQYPEDYDYSLTYSVGDPGVYYDDSTGNLTLVIGQLPGLEIHDMDSVWIIVAQMCDNAQSCGPNCVTDAMMCPRYIVAEFECRAHPNPFTPNGDGSNDVVYIQYPKMAFKDAVVHIYDMQDVEIKTITVGDGHTYVWDGTDSEGNPCRPGVYLYAIEVDGEIICTGSVVLAR